MDRQQDQMTNRLNDSSTESPQEIQREIDRTRAQMDDTIDRIQDRLHPRQFIDRITGMFKGSGSSLSNMSGDLGDAGRQVADHIRRNPIAYGAIAAGIGLLIYKQMRDRQQDDVETLSDGHDLDEMERTDYEPIAYESEYGPGAAAVGVEVEFDESDDEPQMDSGMSDVALRARERAEQIRQGMTERGQSIKERARHRATRMRRRAQTMAARTTQSLRGTYESTKEQAREQFDDHPLSFGAAAMAAGMIVGFLLPRTRREDQLVGSESRQVKAKAKDAGRDVIERGKAVVQAAAESAKQSAKQEAREQGLAPEKDQSRQTEPGREQP
jgi:ElaB/YqjD/DUF883 family membrane-anchored ribosome-binding protein